MLRHIFANSSLGRTAKRTVPWAFVLMLLLLRPAASRGDSYYYTITGAVNVTFTLSSTPVILSNNSDSGYGFIVTPTNLTINGVASSDSLAFYSLLYGGGFGAFSDGSDFAILTSGPQFYSGSESAPTMLGPGVLPVGAGILTDYYNTLSLYAVTVTDLGGNLKRPGMPDARTRTPEASEGIYLAIVLLALTLLTLKRR
jgi:hypothetical protein